MPKVYAFVGAHPDDVELNAGGTIAKLCSKGKHVRVVICTDCGEDRHREAVEALKALGVLASDVVFLKETDTKVACSPLTVALEEHLAGVHTIFTHHPEDTHQDHREVSLAVQAAGRKCDNILYFMGMYPSGRYLSGGNPNTLSLFSKKCAQAKKRALATHRSQSVKYGQDEWIASILSSNKGDAWKYGGKHGHAEMFQCGRTRL